MKLSRLGVCGSAGHFPVRFITIASLALSACSSGTELEAAQAAPEPYATRPLTPEVTEQIWANMFGGFTRASQLALTPEEQHAIALSLEESVSLESLGVAPEDVSFVGANVLVQDVSFSAEPLLERLRSEAVDKGKVLNQVVTTVIGKHDTSLVAPQDVIGASIQYASQTGDGAFNFARPEVDAEFAHVVVLADAVPQAIFNAFRDSIAEIGNASEADCLSPTFLQVFSRSEFDAEFAERPFDVPPRVLEVVYAPEICGPTALGCTQYPRAENVVLSPTSPEGQIGTFQRRVSFGSFMGINSTQITPEAPDFSTITHELLHAMGIAHPVPEAFRSGALAAKLVVPGTEPRDSGFESIMAFRTSTDRVLELSADDIDTIETLYSSAHGCSYSSEPITITAN